MFWSGDKLQEELENLIEPSKGAVNRESVDCAAITLTVGNEIYVTPNGDKDPTIKQILTDDNPQFIIPTGQFALLLTDETVYVPKTALAFISFKAKYKFKGLINVSGFHVDPGWKGKLTFSVYNAGPTSIVLEKGAPFALIWYADLDRPSSKKYVRHDKSPAAHIQIERVADMMGEVYSPFKLKKELDELKKELLTLESKIVTRYSTIIFAVFTTVIAFALREKIIAVGVNLSDYLGF